MQSGIIDRLFNLFIYVDRTVSKKRTRGKSMITQSNRKLDLPKVSSLSCTLPSDGVVVNQCLVWSGVAARQS